jgi:hypothetical protein
MDSSQDGPPTRNAPISPGEAKLRAVMEQSDHDVAGGQSVDLTDVLADLDGIADRIEARGRIRWA